MVQFVYPFTKEFDEDIGLVYMFQRWYSPELGIFVSSAPYPPMTEHRYSFGVQNPTDFVDPLGLKARRGWKAGEVANDSSQYIYIHYDSEEPNPGWHVLPPGEKTDENKEDADFIWAPGERAVWKVGVSDTTVYDASGRGGLWIDPGILNLAAQWVIGKKPNRDDGYVTTGFVPAPPLPPSTSVLGSGGTSYMTQD